MLPSTASIIIFFAFFPLSILNFYYLRCFITYMVFKLFLGFTYVQMFHEVICVYSQLWGHSFSWESFSVSSSGHVRQLYFNTDPYSRLCLFRLLRINWKPWGLLHPNKHCIHCETNMVIDVSFQCWGYILEKKKKYDALRTFICLNRYFWGTRNSKMTWTEHHISLYTAIAWWWNCVFSLDFQDRGMIDYLQLLNLNLSN